MLDSEAEKKQIGTFSLKKIKVCPPKYWNENYRMRTITINLASSQHNSSERSRKCLIFLQSTALPGSIYLGGSW